VRATRAATDDPHQSPQQQGELEPAAEHGQALVHAAKIPGFVGGKRSADVAPESLPGR